MYISTHSSEVHRSDGSEHNGGDRSSVFEAVDAAVHGEPNPGVLWLTGVIESAMKCSKASDDTSGRGGDMAGGSELSGSVASAVTGRNQQKGERGWEQKLTASRTVVLAGSWRS